MLWPVGSARMCALGLGMVMKMCLQDRANTKMSAISNMLTAKTVHCHFIHSKTLLWLNSLSFNCFSSSSFCYCADLISRVIPFICIIRIFMSSIALIMESQVHCQNPHHWKGQQDSVTLGWTDPHPQTLLCIICFINDPFPQCLYAAAPYMKSRRRAAGDAFPSLT